MAVRIGELLLKEKRITPAQLQEALNYQKTSGGKLGLNLVKLGFVKDDEITALLSKQYGVPSINLVQFEIDPGIIKLIPAETAHKYQIVPLSRSGAIPAFSSASQLTSSISLCCGSSVTASRGEIPKKFASNAFTSPRNPPCRTYAFPAASKASHW